MPEAIIHKKPPPLLLSLLEAPRALAEASMLLPSHRLLSQLPKGNGHPVMSLPGFLGSDSSTMVLRRYLKLWGYRAHPWKLGRNLGSPPDGRLEMKLKGRLDDLYRSSGRRKVSLIGWSLGGLLARELARAMPDRVRGVITLGSPLGYPKATNAWRVYEMVTGSRVDDADVLERLKRVRQPIPGVPATAIFSRSDSVVAWRTAREPRAALTENIEVVGSHFGLGFNPSVLYVIADRLHHLSHGGWRPFEIREFRRLFYRHS